MVTIFLTQVMTPWALSRCIFCAFEQTSQKLSQTSGNNGCWTLSRCYAECRFTSLVVHPVAWFGCWFCVCSILGIQNSFRVSDLTFHEQIHSSIIIIIADLQSWGCFRVLGDHLVQMFLVQLKFRNCFKCLKALHGIHSVLSGFFGFLLRPTKNCPAFLRPKLWDMQSEAPWLLVALAADVRERSKARDGAPSTLTCNYIFERENYLWQISID